MKETRNAFSWNAYVWVLFPFISGIQYVSFSDYLNIDNLEMQRGKNCEKPREKITTLQEMIDVAFRNKNNGSWK